ncbi:tripartite tricarboxylate transporter TctB family protein [Thermoflavimicrobium dichotomicum]|uniref:Putative tricarboxylic transport membrane protein n=1 Tax=Thermoflavimicrobium dichotomicum TaxID=46223 RepID=A0A1I3Q630_9BACL|nr:tripartite tricarboxylate transporter TctB family protein [Thermoflavimicrobium dichotomicum]SFJ29328.1 putative tricarboxylic transport membrane protein [Thermoflavimicrobium dichotomicum]
MSRSFDRIASILFILVGVFFIVESRKLSSTAYGSGVGPDLFPMGLGILLILLSIRLIFETFRYPKEKQEGKTLDIKRFAIILFSALLYALLMETLGYVLTTFLFLVVAFQTMERGKWWLSIILAAAFSVGVYYLYVNILKGTLPSFPF